MALSLPRKADVNANLLITKKSLRALFLYLMPGSGYKSPTFYV